VTIRIKFTKNESDDQIVHVYREAAHGWDGIGWVEKDGAKWSATPGVGNTSAHGFKTRKDAGEYLNNIQPKVTS